MRVLLLIDTFFLSSITIISIYMYFVLNLWCFVLFVTVILLIIIHKLSSSSNQCGYVVQLGAYVYEAQRQYTRCVKNQIKRSYSL